MDQLNYTRDSLRKFGMVMAIAFTAISLIIFWKHRHSPVPAITLALAFLLPGIFFPACLKPVYIIWMRLAFVLAWINTRLILMLMFYLVLTPIGLCLRLCGVDLLDKNFRKRKNSYWIKKEPEKFNSQTYERQF